MSWIASQLDSNQRIVAVSAPTGSGKTILAVLAGLLSGRRTVILTATKALQDQYRDSMRGLSGLADIRGQNSYACNYEDGLTAEEGPCHVGVQCPLKTRGCIYYERLAAARNASTKIVLTNYSCWMALMEHTEEGLGKCDLLVLDEAHFAYDAISSFMAVVLHPADVGPLGAILPRGEAPETWKRWGNDVLPGAVDMLDKLKEEAVVQRESGQSRLGPIVRSIKQATHLVRKLKTLASMKGDWVVDRALSNRVELAPVWPAHYTESALLREVPKVLLLSATIRPKTLDLLGIGDYAFGDVPSTFPVANRRVLHIPTVRMNRRATKEDISLWAVRIDQIVSTRLDRKGLLHTVSYARRDAYLTQTRFKDILFVHGARDTAAAVYRFRKASPPALMVSPSLMAGHDFPGEQCEYVIIGKIPYPDTRSPIVQARQDTDPDWAPYHAMQALVQASGRGVRSAQDRCETFIVDDDWRWFWGRYREMAPSWFGAAVGAVTTIPRPSEKIGG